jgi:nitroreductase
MSNPVIDLLHARFPGRAIAPDALDDAVVVELIEAARMTPSCRNFQPWRFLFLRGEEGLEHGRAALAEANAWAGNAPLLVVATARREDDCHSPDGRDYYRFDVGMAVMNLMLAATANGLAARPMAGFDPEVIRDRFALEPEVEPIVMIAVGRPSTDDSQLPDHHQGAHLRPRIRKAPGEIVTVV